MPPTAALGCSSDAIASADGAEGGSQASTWVARWDTLASRNRCGFGSVTTSAETRLEYLMHRLGREPMLYCVLGRCQQLALELGILI